jgi:hypothetical protein
MARETLTLASSRLEWPQIQTVDNTSNTSIAHASVCEFVEVFHARLIGRRKRTGLWPNRRSSATRCNRHSRGATVRRRRSLAAARKLKSLRIGGDRNHEAVFTRDFRQCVVYICITCMTSSARRRRSISNQQGHLRLWTTRRASKVDRSSTVAG